MNPHVTAEPIGRIASLHRYPIKSMGGEDLTTTHVTERGVLGDRAYALQDTATGHAVSAKHPSKWPGILGWKASFGAAVELDGELPLVDVTIADGPAISSRDKVQLEREASRVLGRPVTLERARPKGGTFEYHWPDMDGLVHEGRTYRDEVTAHQMPAGTFFDSSTIHLLTTASLDEMRTREAESLFERERFRPNIVLESSGTETGFVENTWVGSVLAIGDAVRVRIPGPCLRCVMVNLGQGSMPPDARVLKAVFAHNDGNLGVKGEIVRTGRVSVGDPVFRLPA